MDTTPYRQRGSCRAAPLLDDASRPSSVDDEAALEFACFRVLLRQRRFLADGVPVELGSRAFDLLLALLEADGMLVTKDELISRAWPGIVVSEENLKVQICALRKALGGDRDIIRTEVGRGYRLTAAIRRSLASPARHCSPRWQNCSAQRFAAQRRTLLTPHLAVTEPDHP